MGNDLYNGFYNTKNIRFYTGSGSGTGNLRMIVNQSGNVGIGTNLPQTKLDVNGNAIISNTHIRSNAIEINRDGTGNRYAYIDLIGDDTYDDYGLRIIRYDDGSNSVSMMEHRGTGPLKFLTKENAEIQFIHDASRKLRIYNSIRAETDIIAEQGISSYGSIGVTGAGISTSSSDPQYPNNAFANLNSSAELMLWSVKPKIHFLESVSSLSDQWSYYIQMNNRDLMILDGGQNVTMAFDQNNYVGIGHPNPSYRLHVLEDSRTDHFAAMIQHNGNSYRYHGLRIAAGAAGSSSSNTYMIDFRDGDFTNVGSITLRNGSIYFNTSSDRRLKTKISSAKFNGLETIKNIPVVNFAFKESPESLHTGFIAQDIQKVFPEAVSKNEEGYLQLALPNLIPVLTKAIQEQDHKITRLEQENKELKQTIKNIYKMLENK